MEQLSVELNRARTAIAAVTAVLTLSGAGCFGPSNPTPFALPTNLPPAPLGKPGADSPIATTMPITVYLVATEGSEGYEKAQTVSGAAKIGCGDYVVPVTVMTVGNPLAPLRNAMNALFATGQDDATAKGYFTALAGSTITVGDITKREDGTSVIDLRGKLLSAGTCDDPRIKEQVERTANAYGNAEILLNGSESGWRCFGDMSGKCA